MPRSNSVRDHGSPPKGFISQRCWRAFSGAGRGSGRVLRKEISSPLGDHRGCACVSVPRVNWISFFSVRLLRKRLLTRLSFSRSAADFTHTAHLPSGEMRNCPAVSVKTTSSGFHSFRAGSEEFGLLSAVCARRIVPCIRSASSTASAARLQFPLMRVSFSGIIPCRLAAEETYHIRPHGCEFGPVGLGPP